MRSTIQRKTDREKEGADKETKNRLFGATRGVIVGISSEGEPLVDFCGNSTGRDLVAISTVPVHADDRGREAVLLFEDGDVTRPLLIGLVQSAPESLPQRSKVDITVDGRRVTFAAQNEISLRCGDASITLTREGKVLIKGSYVLSKSTGPNRIKGGSVQLN